MESKKLPVLYMDASDPILKVTDEHVTSGVVLTNRPYLTNREPYIPVARVREKVTEILQRLESESDLHARCLYAHTSFILESLIADVEDHEG